MNLEQYKNYLYQKLHIVDKDICFDLEFKVENDIVNTFLIISFVGETIYCKIIDDYYSSNDIDKVIGDMDNLDLIAIANQIEIELLSKYLLIP